jgi:integrase
MPLTDRAAKAAAPREKTYKLSDEKGMYLEITPKGQKYWRWKYRFAGKEKRLALGVYPEVSLKEARSKRDDGRKQLSQGIDPSAAKQSQKAAQRMAGENSFAVVALEWFKTKMGDKSKSHRDRTVRALEKDIFPTLGRAPINDITPPQLLAVLRKIENRGAIETAKRAKQTCGQIFRYGIATGRCERDPSADLAGSLKTVKEKHLAAITDPKEVGQLMVAIDNYQGTATVCAALKLSPLLFCRPGELRHMEWSEINWEEEQWEIPANKGGENKKISFDHIVPLSTQALEILREQQLLTSKSKYVFPSARQLSRPLSENGVRTALRTMGYDNETMTPHGFRAMARTLLDEQLGYKVEWIEQQLAHAVKDHLGRAYNRTTHLPQRKKMMQHWSDYLDQLKTRSSNVVQLKTGG